MSGKPLAERSRSQRALKQGPRRDDTHGMRPGARTSGRWLAEARDFDTLVVNGLHGGHPDIVPVHYFLSGPEQVAVHLARANPMWQAIEATARSTTTPSF
jgi:hypothetical protein